MSNDKIMEILIKLNDMKKFNNQNEVEILNFLDFSSQYFAEDEQIQFQIVKLLRKLNKKEEALKICNKFSNDEMIQSQKIKILMELGYNNEILKLCDKFPKNERIQSQKITILMKLNKKEEALEICDKFPENEKIQSQKITILMKLKQNNEALKICDKFAENEIIQSQKIKILMKLKQNKEALKICNKFSEYEPIQSQKITILMKINQNKEALEICDKFPENEKVQSQKITILMKLNQNKEALKICDKFPKVEIIQSQKMTILMKLNRNEEALEIYNKFPENKYINKKKTIINSENSINNIFIVKSDKSLVSTLLTNIYFNNISDKQIENSNLNDYEKAILLIAYYEKINKQKAINIIKLKKKNTKNESEIKTYNILLEKLSRKKNSIFDIMIYTNILDCFIDFENHSNFIETEPKEIKKETIIQQKMEISENKPTKKYITMSGKVVNNRTVEKTFKDEQIVKTSKSESPLIKDAFKNEIINISKLIYVELYNPERQKDAIKAWDILDDIANTSIENKKTLNKIIRIINLVFPDEAKSKQKKYEKYL